MNVMEWLKVLLLGIVEGVTEWLPISSTGHMILVNEFIRLNVSKEFMEMFLVVIQLGAILAVVVLYFGKLWPFTTPSKGWIKKETWSLWFKVLVAVLPAALIGLPFDDKIDALFYNYQTVAFTLILYGVLFIVIENHNKGRKPRVRSFEQLSYPMALFIGVFQVLALIPGTSRSGATILGATLLGASRYIAAEFSFFLAIPVMFGASLLKLLKFGFAFTGTEAAILIVGMVTAFVVSVLAIKFLMGYIKKNDFKAFGYYRIVLGALVIVYFLLFN
ncbi:undecaprenyl-diphosphate phosphatase [Candidatus Merdisoma sp. HCP28S3_D10]|uniref:undecaprenyl-diphosphate phosphatase n=1 Tax=unclassified Candidatus Merdisoma TaxID=3099611 RepID=UPI003F8A6CEE